LSGVDEKVHQACERSSEICFSGMLIAEKMIWKHNSFICPACRMQISGDAEAAVCEAENV